MPAKTEAGIDTRGEGTAYLLPARYVRVIVERKKSPTKEQLQKKVADAKEALEKIAKLCPPLKENKEKLEARLKAQAPGEGAIRRREEWQSAYNESATDLGICESQQKLKKLEKDVAEFELLHATDAEFVDSIKLELDPVVGDPDLRFVIDMNHEAVREDSWKIKTTPAGLLTSSDAESADKTADILVELSRFAGAMLSAATQGTVFSGEPPPKRVRRSKIAQPFKFERVFDVSRQIDDAMTNEPCSVGTTPLSVSEINGCLKALEVNFELAVTNAVGGPAWKSATVGTTPSAGTALEGLVYRRPRPYVLTVLTCAPLASEEPATGHPSDAPAQKKRADGVEPATPPECNVYASDIETKKRQVKFVTESIVVSVPNGSPLEVVPYKAASFVTTTTKTQFADGMLTDVDVKRPSELLSVAQTPYRMLQGFGQALREVSPVRVDYTNRQRDVADAEAKYYDAQKRALDAKLAYEKALATSMPAPVQ